MRAFGLIGYPLLHSFSKKYFEEKFKSEKIEDAVFENFPLKYMEEISAVIKNNPHLKGLSVTIPYKKAVVSFLNERDTMVEETGVCNCIKIQDKKLTGFNTDIIGFEKSFTKNLNPLYKKALILGTGGAAFSVAFILKKLNIDYLFVSGKKGNGKTILYTNLNEEVMRHHNIIINCTPVGTLSNSDAPAIPYQFITKDFYLFDLVYNPSKTKFLFLGEEKNATTQNGYQMLITQAEASWKIWNE